MSAENRCPQCGCELPEGAAYGVCPKCLLQPLGPPPDGWESSPPATQLPAAGTPVASRRSGDRFVAPPPAELARHFPQLEIIRLLGQGGMGAVYQARQRGLDRMVALKILPPSAADDPHFSERFNREARALARLSHPHIVAVYDSGHAGPYFYLLMEYVDGVNLRQAMLSGKIQPGQTLEMVTQICDALQYAHNERVVHRDIKPENVLIDGRGQIKVADFGLAKMVDPDLADPTLTNTHQVMGTPRYMAPEQLEGARDVDHRADIFSLGVVFYELLTGELPLGRFAPPSRKVQIDVRLDEVVLRTLEKQPDMRYQQASELRTDVETIRSGSKCVRRGGYEYKSRASIFGIPLIHMAAGLDPATGRQRIAKGVIAIGDTAIGGLAIGGSAFGGVAIGGIAIGIIALGGLTIGGLVMGGLAVGLLAVGGVAAGYLALGGFAIGAEPYGGAVVRLGPAPAIRRPIDEYERASQDAVRAPSAQSAPYAPVAPHPYSPEAEQHASDQAYGHSVEAPNAVAFVMFRSLLLIGAAVLVFVGLPLGIVALVVMSVMSRRRGEAEQLSIASGKPPPAGDSSSSGCMVAAIIVGAIGAVVVLVVLCGVGGVFFWSAGSSSAPQSYDASSQEH